MKKKEKKQKSTFWKDFKAFISRGNIVDLAVALVVGAAFTAIVNSLVNDVIKPLIALLVDGNFSELVVVLRPEEVNEAGEVIAQAITLNYGNLIMAILTFLIDAFVIFTVLRIVRKAQKRMKETAEELKAILMRKETEEGEAEQGAEPQADEGAKEGLLAKEAEAQQEKQAEEKAEEKAESVESLLVQIRDLLQESREKTGESDKK